MYNTQWFVDLLMIGMLLVFLTGAGVASSGSVKQFIKNMFE